MAAIFARIAAETQSRNFTSVSSVLWVQWKIRPESMTMVWPVIVSVRHIVTT
jgi:hypothetical protein